ncbi:hypothetical protein GOBAR_AA25804 [Gossypium barbadense]|uniref:DUF4283 domain-containing protein n=1 Tax=Gossypium barbadense TaxID=3634 RepID=A0A2P5WUU0_GOSBA|nr:hypothetical protein GOBAR_AA25804 [Gossypium barbadense]
MANVGNKIGATEVVMVSDDLEIIEDGIRVSLEGLYPETFFLDWVQKILDKSMDLTVVVRLLGRTIGYKTLLNIIQTLWKHVGSFQVIDRDNDYYLVNRDFSTYEQHPSKIVVWMRMSGLPYRSEETTKAFVGINDIPFCIEYEGLPLICYKCTVMDTFKSVVHQKERNRRRPDLRAMNLDHHRCR